MRILCSAPAIRTTRAAGVLTEPLSWPLIEPAGRWRESDVAAFKDFSGVAWFRNTVELSAAQARAATTLALGQVADADTTWVNGVRVGAGVEFGEDLEVAAAPIPGRVNERRLRHQHFFHFVELAVAGDDELLHQRALDRRAAVRSHWRCPGRIRGRR